MALTKDLAVDMPVYIKGGPFEGHRARVLDPNPILADGQGHPHNRCVKVAVEGVGAGGTEQEHYILPRLLQTEAPAKDEATQITDPMDPALDRFRPSESIVEQYIRRVLPNGMTDIDYLLRLREQRVDGYAPNVALIGQSQSGKSMLARVMGVITAELDGMPKPYPVFTLNGSVGVTNYDIFGQTTAVLVDGKERLVWQQGVVELATRAGGILNLEEWNAVTPAQQIALHPVLDNTRRFLNTQKAVPDGHGGWMPEEVKVNKNLWVLCTINPATYKGTHALSEATTNRFRWLPWDYDEDVEAKLIPSKTVRAIGMALRDMYDEHVIKTPIGTSALVRLNHDAADFGTEMALWSFTAMFTPMDRGVVEAHLESTGLRDTLEGEYPSDGAVELGATWSSNS